MVCACFYDENDNFRNKLWVLTSYDASRKEEDKLRKVVSEETAFKKEVNSSSPLQYSLGTFIKYYKISQLIHTQSIAN